MSPLLGEIKRGGETILSSPVGEGVGRAWGARGAELRSNLYRK